MKVDPTHESAKSFLIFIEDVNERKIQTNTAITFFKGTTYTIKGKWAGAIVEYNKAIEVEPKYGMLYASRGNAYANKDQYNQAIIDYNRAMEINPRLAWACIDRGLVYMEQLGNKSKACSDWKQACELGECYYYTIAKRKGECE